MATFDLAQYNFGELKGLLFDIDQEIKRRQRGDIDAARARIHALAAEAGLSAADVLALAKLKA
jgi:DNA-binding protein H-NS